MATHLCDYVYSVHFPLKKNNVLTGVNISYIDNIIYW